MKDRDELALKRILGRWVEGCHLWRVTDLYRDAYYFNYVVDEFIREAQSTGCSWVAAPAPRAYLLGAVAVGFPCVLHKKESCPAKRSVSGALLPRAPC